jgi:shikimate kinase
MQGRAVAYGAGTILNALATGRGAAFALDVPTTATVELRSSSGRAGTGSVEGTVAGHPDADTRLIERCVERCVEQFGDGETGTVETDSNVPMAAGLKSSSAAANAATLATLDALDVSVAATHAPRGSRGDDDADTGGETPAGSTDEDARLSRVDACRIGVEAARDAGVTVTGAFDDASASMLGGVTVTDNRADDLLAHDAVDWDAVVWTPPERAYSADADVDRCTLVAPVAELVFELAEAGRYAQAMTVNGLAFSAALDFPTDPAVEAMPHAAGVSLSGTGPSVVAVGDRTASGVDLERVERLWADRPGELLVTTVRTDGAHIV